MSTSSSSPEDALPRAPVVGVQESLITIDVSQTPVMKNEVGYVVLGDERLKAEVLRIQGDVADMQVFEETSGVKVGDPVELTGEMLSVALGPGLLGQVFDGLQMPLAVLAGDHGFFLPRGVQVEALDHEKKWKFEAGVSVGAKLVAGQALGSVQEGPFAHKIMVPFDEVEPVEVTWIQGGSFTVDEPVARIKRPDGERARGDACCSAGRCADRFPQGMLQRRIAERLYPDGADHHHPAHHRHVPADRARRHRLHSGSLRRRQDGAAELHRAPLDDRRRHHHRLRRARRRGRGDHQRVPGDEGPAHRRLADGSHHHHLQHVVDAGGRARVLDLHRHHARRVLPADGLRRAAASPTRRRAGRRRCARPRVAWRRSPARRPSPPTSTRRSRTSTSAPACCRRPTATSAASP